MGKQFQIQHKEEKDKTKSEKEMEYLDSVLEQTERSLEPKKSVILYKNRINKENLSFNLIMTCVWFGLGYLLSGGSIWGGIIISLILVPMMEWREVDREIEIPHDTDEVQINKPNKKMSATGQEALLKYAEETGLIEHQYDMSKKPMQKTASRKQAENAFKEERFVNLLNNHLVKGGQIKKK